MRLMHARIQVYSVHLFAGYLASRSVVKDRLEVFLQCPHFYGALSVRITGFC
jgi:hypothetical protein